MDRRQVRRRRATGAARRGPSPSKQTTGTTLIRSGERAGEGARSPDDKAAVAAGDEPEALIVTHWFDSGQHGETYAATVRFRGQRNGVRGKPTAPDAFVKDELIQGIVPGSGPVSITSRVYGLTPGEWKVTAELQTPGARDGRRPIAGSRAARGHTLPRAEWSWRRWALSSGPFNPVHTRWAPLARLVSPPAVVPGSWSALVALGVVVGLAIQSALLSREEVSIGRSLTVTVVGLLAGLIGAKLRYIALHPRTWREVPAEGWAVDGFLAAMPIVVLIGLLVFQLPIGLFVDASTPALFFGIAIGRLGCFLTGCCAGRCTSSRWAIWSSDRRVGARRIPTQLLESTAGLFIGIATLAIFIVARPAIEGVIFVGALAAYSVLRRALLRLRAER
ncbi:MAG: prolipoprotein diacylglyceryl transferase [Chloroflexota bacterium]|nr:prolipoprotein diacylglyceryl transferase [Chloroflexota bacterium]